MWKAVTDRTLIIVSFNALRQDADAFAAREWAFVVVDEGHVLQNPKSKLASAVTSLRAEHRLVLTGTPIQNHVTDMWCLFDFLLPGYLGDHAAFVKK